jgi:hypothetical protein
MLLTNKLNTKIVPLNIKHLKNFYPNIKLYDIIEIDINHLSKKSPIVIECMCEICGINNKIQYRAYLRNKKRYNYYSCKKCKNKKTDITKKILYGDSKYNNPYKMIQTKEERGIYIPISSVDNFKKYRKLVNRLTLRNKKLLFDDWDGIDFYDNENIKLNLIKMNSNNMYYPTIDHKISIFEGFHKNIPPYIIGGIENLCITKRKINLLKSNKENFIF